MDGQGVSKVAAVSITSLGGYAAGVVIAIVNKKYGVDLAGQEQAVGALTGAGMGFAADFLAKLAGTVDRVADAIIRKLGGGT